MIKTIKNIIKRTNLYDIIRRLYQKKTLRDWEKRNKPVPPPTLIKQRIIKQYAKKFHTHILIETGTYFGDTVYATKNTFDRIFSIELDRKLYERAKKRFAKFKNVTIIQGDSSEVLPRILSEIRKPCLFWLDAHYYTEFTAKGKLETPIIQELHHILNHYIKEHVILIDDARYFVGENDYPTIPEVRKFIIQTRPDMVLEIKNDIIRIHLIA